MARTLLFVGDHTDTRAHLALLRGEVLRVPTPAAARELLEDLAADPMVVGYGLDVLAAAAEPSGWAELPAWRWRARTPRVAILPEGAALPVVGAARLRLTELEPVVLPRDLRRLERLLAGGPAARLADHLGIAFPWGGP